MGMMDEARAGKDLYATFDTTEGTIVVKLLSKEAPITVENFVGLATGEKDWKHPGTGEQMKGTPYYDGTIFHRCLPNFMVQGGDPLGEGYGGPGFNIPDEYQSGRTFAKKGILAMANTSRPNSGGAQFFITVVPTPHLNNKHTIFGEVVKGQEIADRIANEIPKNSSGRPNKPIVINKLAISTSAPA
ncbi:peptidylprolyl isomerase [Melittangium boletus]|uniref:Peptidyl-prolyl cis-trans isomerase n=1 Tax=Melittangium boletus DSM 14713 TaxID=1294270 RepID=A0A250IPL1_9BACT|nr:peptidylprolyl isomerase [Melittangium boletus]ATB33689.1 cyclophilin [Melittangium boletus DSM 14713]